MHPRSAGPKPAGRQVFSHSTGPPLSLPNAQLALGRGRQLVTLIFVFSDHACRDQICRQVSGREGACRGAQAAQKAKEEAPKGAACLDIVSPALIPQKAELQQSSNAIGVHMQAMHAATCSIM